MRTGSVSLCGAKAADRLTNSAAVSVFKHVSFEGMDG